MAICFRSMKYKQFLKQIADVYKSHAHVAKNIHAAAKLNMKSVLRYISHKNLENQPPLLTEYATEIRHSNNLDNIEALALGDIQTCRPIFIRRAIEIIKLPHSFCCEDRRKLNTAWLPPFTSSCLLNCMSHFPFVFTNLRNQTLLS